MLSMSCSNALSLRVQSIPGHTSKSCPFSQCATFSSTCASYLASQTAKVPRNDFEVRAGNQACHSLPPLSHGSSLDIWLGKPMNGTDCMEFVWPRLQMHFIASWPSLLQIEHLQMCNLHSDRTPQVQLASDCTDFMDCTPSTFREFASIGKPHSSKNVRKLSGSSFLVASFLHMKAASITSFVLAK